MRIILSIIAVVLLCSVSVYGQVDSKIDCDDDCVNASLPFLFCDMNTGQRVTKCSQNPNAEQGFRPLKKRLPPWCHNYDASGLVVIQDGYSFVQIDGEDTTIIFASANVEGAGYSASVEWWLESGCKPQTDGDDCCLNLKWAGDRSQLLDFAGKPDKVLAITHNDIPPSSGSPDCRVNCSGTWIILNSTPEFTEVDKNNNVPTRFFYNIEEPDGNGQLASGDKLEYYHLYSVLLHEVGHWYGIGHLGEPDSYGQVCGDTRGVCVMSGGTGGGGLYAGEERSLTRYPDDLCAFRKLYCCAETATDVAENTARRTEVQHNAFTVYPNPSQGQPVSVALSEELARYGKRLRIIDERGTTVYTAAIGIGELLYTVPTDALRPGVYVVDITVQGLNGSISKKIVIR